MTHTLQETADGEAFVRDACDWISERIHDAVYKRGICFLGLSGGSTPVPVYEALGKRKDIDWENVTLFLVDERCVPPDHDDANQKLIRDHLLAHIPADRHPQLLFPDTSLPPDECASEYGAALTEHLDGDAPDVLVLGMGADGHIASLFPPVTAAASTLPSVHTATDAFAVHDRISLGFPLLASARSALFLLKGSEKKTVWNEMMASADDERRWPAKRILADVRDVVSLWTV